MGQKGNLGMWIWLARLELEETMTFKSGLEQQGQTILNFHFSIVTLMTGTLYQTPLCLLPAWTLLKLYYLIIFVNSHMFPISYWIWIFFFI